MQWIGNKPDLRGIIPQGNNAFMTPKYHEYKNFIKFSQKLMKEDELNISRNF